MNNECDKLAQTTEAVKKFFDEHNLHYDLKEGIDYEKEKVNCLFLTEPSEIPWHKKDEKCNSHDTYLLIKPNGTVTLDGVHRTDKTHTWFDFLCHYEPKYRKQKEEPKKTEPKKKFEIKLVQGRKLQKESLPPICYAIEGLFPEGYTILSAPFKFGKSWYALESCLAIAEGKDFLGMKTTKGTAVYLALEDCDKFAQERLNVALNNEEAPEGFYYIYEDVPTIDNGLIDYFEELYNTLPDIRIIVIDVLAKVECQLKRGETAYNRDYRTGTALKQFADSKGISIVAITHTTKYTHTEDVFMNTTGTNGVTGSADAIVTIAKENRTDKEGVLAITGRRVREKYLKVHLKDGYLWESSGETDLDDMKKNKAQTGEEQLLAEYENSPIRKAVIKLAQKIPNERLQAREISNRSQEYGIVLMEDAKSIGLFLHKFKNYFLSKDNLNVSIIKNGTGSTIYSLKFANDFDDARSEEIPF